MPIGCGVVTPVPGSNSKSPFWPPAVPEIQIRSPDPELAGAAMRSLMSLIVASNSVTVPSGATRASSLFALEPARPNQAFPSEAVVA